MWLDMEFRCWRMVNRQSFIHSGFIDYLPCASLYAKCCFLTVNKADMGPALEITGQWERQVLNKWTQIYLHNHELICVQWKKRGGCLAENDWVSDFRGRSTKASERKGHLCWDMLSARQKKRKSIWSSGSSGKDWKQQRAWYISGSLDKPTNDKWLKVEGSGEMRAQEGPCRLLNKILKERDSTLKLDREF